MLKSTKAMLGRYVAEVRSYYLGRLQLSGTERIHPHTIAVNERLLCRINAMERVLGLNENEARAIHKRAADWACQWLKRIRKPRKS